jgi:prolyl 4-hydroxylase
MGKKTDRSRISLSHTHRTLFSRWYRYEVGEKYNTHHDYLDHHVERIPGVRLLTVYFYLNDVPAGGGTYFPTLNLNVTPKQGRVVIWPSVLDGRTSEKDSRTLHSALPVEEGVKYGTDFCH